jgi:S-adenosylmethionine:tRNA ribosyltransferase-isomerase
MIAARELRKSAERLLVIDVTRGELRDGFVTSLAAHARPGDLWVLNDAATLPASLAGHVHDRGVELRLAAETDRGWRAVLFGEGSWRDDTDHRPAPPHVEAGDTISLGGSLSARVLAIDPRSPRLLEVSFEPRGDAFWRALYAVGRPIQYSYLAREMQLGEMSTAYAARPWSVELPSAGRPLSIDRLASLRKRGAEIVTLTHAAGLSATGDRAIDAILPLPERYEIPEATARAIARAKRDRRRIVAVGTSTTRALEGSAITNEGVVRAGVAETDLILGPHTRRRVVDALLTGAHDPTSSHYSLLAAFAPMGLLAQAVARSDELGYLIHELGDSWLVLGA